jgi:hypothetical protein
MLTTDIDFTQHIKVTLQAAHRQGREALLLGVRRGELHPVRARKVWCAFVEPKFGYGIGYWLAGSSKIAMSMIDRIQCIVGAQQLMGVWVYRRSGHVDRQMLACSWRVDYNQRGYSACKDC